MADTVTITVTEVAETVTINVSQYNVPTPEAENDFIVSNATPGWVRRTLAQVKTILGLGTAAYTAVTDYVTHALVTAANDFLVASGAGVVVKKTLAETQTILNFIPAETATPGAITNIDCTTYKNWVLNLDQNTTLNLNNITAGEHGYIIVYTLAYYTVVLGDMFVIRAGGVENIRQAGNYIIYWTAVNDNAIAYTIETRTIAVRSVAYADPISLDGTANKSFICSSVTGNTTVNLINVADGDAGSIELIIDATGGYTVSLGAMFTKKFGSTSIVATANKDNLISWMKSGDDILYTIIQKV